MRTRGDEKKGQGIQQVAIKSVRRERKKDSAVDETELTQNRKGKDFFFEVCVQISLLFPSLSNTCHNSSL